MEVIVNNAAVIGAVFFSVVFFGITLWVFWPGKKEKFKEYSTIPLMDSSEEENENGRR